MPNPAATAEPQTPTPWQQLQADVKSSSTAFLIAYRQLRPLPEPSRVAMERLHQPLWNAARQQLDLSLARLGRPISADLGLDRPSATTRP